jgi:hypothetical protein
MAQRWFKAQDTFVAVLGDGSQAFVSKGDTLPDSHELVKRDLGGSKTLFRQLDTGEEDEAPAKSEPAKAEPKAAPVKAAGKAP